MGIQLHVEGHSHQVKSQIH